MNEAKIEAIAEADAHTQNVGLPTYSELLAAVNSLLALELPDVGSVRAAKTLAKIAA